MKASVRYLDTTKLVDDPLIGSSVRLQVIRKGHLAVFTSRVTRRCAPFQSLLGVLSSSYYWPASLLLFGHLTNAMNPGQMLCDVVEKFANEWIPLEYSVTLMWFFVFTVHCFFLRCSIHSCRPLPLLHDNIKLLHVFINFVLLNTSPWFHLFSSDLFLRAVQPLGHSLPENNRIRGSNKKPAIYCFFRATRCS